MSIVAESFGETLDGQDVTAFILTNGLGATVKIINYGAALVSVEVPDREGSLADVVLGFDDMAGYQRADNPYFGACCGRYANRIAKGLFSVDGVEYPLAINNGPNALHGGLVGFDKKVWDAEIVSILCQIDIDPEIIQNTDLFLLHQAIQDHVLVRLLRQKP